MWAENGWNLQVPLEKENLNRRMQYEYADVLNNARQCIGQYCKAFPVANGVACKNQIPGPGAMGRGRYGHP